MVAHYERAAEHALEKTKTTNGREETGNNRQRMNSNHARKGLQYRKEYSKRKPKILSTTQNSGMKQSNAMRTDTPGNDIKTSRRFP